MQCWTKNKTYPPWYVMLVVFLYSQDQCCIASKVCNNEPQDVNQAHPIQHSSSSMAAASCFTLGTSDPLSSLQLPKIYREDQKASLKSQNGIQLHHTVLGSQRFSLLQQCWWLWFCIELFWGFWWNCQEWNTNADEEISSIWTRKPNRTNFSGKYHVHDGIVLVSVRYFKVISNILTIYMKMHSRTGLVIFLIEPSVKNCNSTSLLLIKTTGRKNKKKCKISVEMHFLSLKEILNQKRYSYFNTRLERISSA